jgi:predicted AlkP superfamily pyrophosphatase or phosphodiesterase
MHLMCTLTLFFVPIALLGAVVGSPPPPRLAVVISVDQMRADFWERFAPFWGESGFRRFEAGSGLPTAIILTH